MHSVLLLLLLSSSPVAQEIPVNLRRYSNEAELGHSPCPDTIKVLFFKKIVDMDVMLPTWQPVLSLDSVTLLEGTVIPRPNSKHIDTHVSPVDLPLFHYTHDFTFNVRPDQTPDGRFTRLLAHQIRTKEIDGKTIIDTTIRPYMHVEWEIGIGQGNKGNPASKHNISGASFGFFTHGHSRGEELWNWPTIGDWVHLEGLWVWDRGHPPAGTEIHPIRFLAIRRQLPDKILTSDSVWRFATRIDLFANGNGGALKNNLPSAPRFVHRTPMGEKDYVFRIGGLLPKPSPAAQIKFKWLVRSGDSFNGDIDLITDQNSDSVTVQIHWKGKSDTLNLGRTLWVFWDEGTGVDPSYKINTYEIQLHTIRFRRNKELFGKSDLRVFLEVGGRWLFQNEFSSASDILNSGFGNTAGKKWTLDHHMVIHVPQDRQFRVHVGGWEADGIDRVFGDLFDSFSSCSPATKEMIHGKLSVSSPFRPWGCMDDHIGEVHAFHSPGELMTENDFEKWSDGLREQDICPCDNGKQNRIFRLNYSIKRQDH